MTKYKRSLVKIKKLKNYVSALFNKPNAMAESDRKVSLIINHIINEKDSQLLISLSSNMYYAKSSKSNILFVLDEIGHCNIMSPVCNYHVSLSRKTAEELVTAFRKKIESRANNLAAEYSKSLEDNLQNIINAL